MKKILDRGLRIIGISKTRALVELLLITHGLCEQALLLGGKGLSINAITVYEGVTQFPGQGPLGVFFYEPGYFSRIRFARNQ